MDANAPAQPVTVTEANAASMWGLLQELFPIYRSLAGPGYAKSLDVVGRHVPLTVDRIPSGSRVFDWIVPKEFHVNASYVIDPNGRKILDFDECSYHVWVYSQPFQGEMDKTNLLRHVSTHPTLRHAVPLMVTYYRERWGLAASQEQVDALPEGRYRVHIDTEHRDGFLRIGECFLPGESEQEVLITSYLCHPLGANDNLSGVVVSAELFRLLAQLPRRRYSYRLAIWPETIGAITYIHKHPERLKQTVGGFVLLAVGDDESGKFHYQPTFEGNTLIDQAARHALRWCGEPYEVLPWPTPLSDERHLNGVGWRLPFGNIMRTPPGKYSTYHTSLDDLKYVKPDALLKSLRVHWKALMAIERARTYRGHFVVEPFLSGKGIYPYDLGVGEGTATSTDYQLQVANAYYYLMRGVDGTKNLLELADRFGFDIELFDRAVADFLKTNLMAEVGAD